MRKYIIYTYDDEIEKVLRPAHLYCGRKVLVEPDNLADDERIPETLASEVSVKRWKHLKKQKQSKSRLV